MSGLDTSEESLGLPVQSRHSRRGQHRDGDLIVAAQLSVDEAHFARVGVANRDRGKSLRERAGAIKLRVDDELAGLVDEAPFAAPDRGKSLRESVGAIKLRVDDELAGLVDEARFVASRDRGKSLRERVGDIKLRVDCKCSRLLRRAAGA